LEPCSGHLEAGQLVAIMGPSGCGKTTLLDMLAMKKSAKYSGQVFVNGRPRDARLFPRIAAYVSQEDEMPAHWKVREALEFDAALKQQPGESRKATADFIDNLLEAFGLTGVANTYIGGAAVRGISGGQRRRVSLARGVAAHASLLFCDEPTSGLAATDAEICVRGLRNIAKRLNVLVLVVIHQPRKEVARLFDTLMLLTSNPGRMVYSGPMEQAADHMKLCGYPVPAHASNPTDFYLDLVTPGTDLDASDALVQSFNERQRPELGVRVEEALQVQGQTVPEMLCSAHQKALGDDDSARIRRMRLGPYAVPFHRQFATLLKRRLQLTMRNPAAIGVQVGMPTLMGLLLGSVFQGIGKSDFGIQTVLFLFITLTMLSLHSLPLMPVLVQERGFMKRESSERLYTVSAHLLTILCVTVPLSLASATIEVLIIYQFSGLSYEYLPVVLAWCLLLFLLFDAHFQCIAAAAPDSEQALGMSLPFLMVFMLFNGLMVTRATAPVYLKWIFQLSPTNYALQAIVMRMEEDATPKEKAFIGMLSYTRGEDFKGMAAIVCMVIILRVFQVLALRFLNKLQK